MSERGRGGAEVLAVTVEDVACWESDPIRATLAPLGGRFTALDVLTKLPAAATAGCLWVVLREELVPARVLRLFAVACARHALEGERDAGREPDPRSWAACDAAEQISDTYGPEWAAALSAAKGAANSTAQAAVRGAAPRAALWAAHGAAKAALAAMEGSTEDAALVSAAAAARRAAWMMSESAEHAWQVAALIALLEGGGAA